MERTSPGGIWKTCTTRDKGKGSGLALVPKLKYEHINLTSFSKMRVDFATQVSITKGIP